VGAGADGVDDPLGNPLAVETRELFEQVLILHQDGAVRAGRLRILIVGDRSAGFGAKRLGHGFVLPAASRRVDPRCPM
jgi:hypothetical protein